MKITIYDRQGDQIAIVDGARVSVEADGGTGNEIDITEDPTDQRSLRVTQVYK